MPIVLRTLSPGSCHFGIALPDIIGLVFALPSKGEGILMLTLIVGMSVAAAIIGKGTWLMGIAIIVGVVNLGLWVIIHYSGGFNRAPSPWILLHGITSFGIIGLFIGSFFVK